MVYIYYKAQLCNIMCDIMILVGLKKPIGDIKPTYQNNGKSYK